MWSWDRNIKNAKQLYGDKITAVDWDEFQMNGAQYFNDCIAVIQLAHPAIGDFARPTFHLTEEQIEMEQDAFLREGAHLTRIMAYSCARHGDPDKLVMLNASAYDRFTKQALDSNPYSDRDSVELNDQTSNFLTKAVRAWEDAAKPAVDADIRVVHLGLGMIADQNSTAFSKITATFRAGLGGPIGSGQQNIPMVSMRDALAAMLHCINKKDITGYVNIVGFNVKQEQLAIELADGIDALPKTEHGFIYSILKWLNICNKIPKPEWLISFVLGPFGRDLLLNNVSVKSDILNDSGFKFKDTTVKNTIIRALAKPIGQLVFRDLLHTTPSSSYSGIGIALQSSNIQTATTPTITTHASTTSSSSITHSPPLVPVSSNAHLATHKFDDEGEDYDFGDTDDRDPLIIQN